MRTGTLSIRTIRGTVGHAIKTPASEIKVRDRTAGQENETRIHIFSIALQDKTSQECDDTPDTDHDVGVTKKGTSFRSFVNIFA